MQTQRDHVHAHQFQMHRMSAALVIGDPSRAECPSRRAITGLFVGVLIAVLIIAGFTVYGLVSPGGKTSWRTSGVIIVEKETGNRYVYLDGALHPTLNLASALLLQGANAKIQLVSRTSLGNVPHGSPIGIRDAPQVLPTAGDVVSGPWLACLAGSVSPGAGERISLNLDPGVRVDALSDDRFALVSARGSEYLLWRGHRYQIADRAVRVALGATGVQPVPAPSAWVESLPAGVDLAVPKIPEVGRTGATVGGRAFRIGQLFNQVTGSGDRLLFVLRRDGLAQISQTAALLLQAGGAGEPVRLDAAAVAAAPISSDRSMAGLLPDLGTARWEDPRGRALCAQQQPSGTDAVDSTVVLTAAENAMVGESGSVTVRARVGTAMLGYPVPRPTSQQAAGRYLISEDGMVYQIADTDALKALRLAGCRQVPIPRYLLLGIPAGPVLSRSAIAVSGQG